jgi:hypothetical protein
LVICRLEKLPLPPVLSAIDMVADPKQVTVTVPVLSVGAPENGRYVPKATGVAETRQTAARAPVAGTKRIRTAKAVARLTGSFPNR